MQRAATVIEQLFHCNYILASISSRYENGSYILCPFLHLILSFINLMFVCLMPSMNSNSYFFLVKSLFSGFHFSVSSTEMSCLSVCLSQYLCECIFQSPHHTHPLPLSGWYRTVRAQQIRPALFALTIASLVVFGHTDKCDTFISKEDLIAPLRFRASLRGIK